MGIDFSEGLDVCDRYWAHNDSLDSQSPIMVVRVVRVIISIVRTLFSFYR